MADSRVLTVPQRLFRSALLGLMLTGLSWILFRYSQRPAQFVLLKQSAVMLMLLLNFLITSTLLFLLTIPRPGKRRFLVIGWLGARDGSARTLTGRRRLLVAFESGLTSAALFCTLKLPQLEVSGEIPRFIIWFCVDLVLFSAFSYLALTCAGG